MLRSCVPKNALGLPFTITGSSGRGAISGGIAADSWAARSSGRPKMPGQAFMLVLVAGVSLLNLALAALVLGGAQVLVSSYGNPVLGSLTIVILAVIILRFRTITI